MTIDGGARAPRTGGMMRTQYKGGATWWALYSYPWYRYMSRYARRWHRERREERG